ncbi:MAG: S26 family signal peptidase [Gemmatimonadales bacterium]
MLGDNGLDSQDSRCYGPVPAAAVVARVVSVDSGGRVAGSCS